MTERTKLILISASITVAALALAALLVFSLWILCAPQTMATSCEKTGNYSFAVTCADLRYKYTKDAYDLSRCVDDSILSGNDKLVVKYGEKLIADKQFQAVCIRKAEETKVDYKSFVCANVAYSHYNRGSLQKAIEYAEFPQTEAGFIKLTVAVAESGSAEDKQKLKAELLKPENDYTDLANIL
ncbi:MAG: hypothetical protein K2K28_02105 [Clostridia bacterium]|nr:hypothetical protein [Clostridia bacterium]